MSVPSKSDCHLFTSKHFLWSLLLSAVVFNFILSLSLRQSLIRIIFENYTLSALSLCSIMIAPLLYSILAASFFQISITQSLLALSPLLLLIFWPIGETSLSILIPLFSVLIIHMIFLFKLTQKDNKLNNSNRLWILCAIIFLYSATFIFIHFEKFNHFQLFNPKDVAVFNQSFWRALRGEPFLNSIYGSALASHSSLFLYLLLPFYSLFPHPLTLLILKTLFLSLAAIPFYLITKDILRKEPPVWFTFCFLFYPFLIGQNLGAPHEMGYAAPFLLWTYFFYRRGYWRPFLLFLLVTTSIKEHLSFVAIGFSFLALLDRRSIKWLLIPAGFGVIWIVFSLKLMAYFHRTYPTDQDPGWLITNIKNRFFSHSHEFLASILRGFTSSNLGALHKLQHAALLFLPLMILFPLLSFVSLLALPEFILNLIADRPVLFSPVWHYNVVVSCFLLVACIEGVKKICDMSWIKKLEIDKKLAYSLISLLMFGSVVLHSYTWLPLAHYEKDPTYVSAAREALALIPADAFVTVSERMAALASSREKFSILRDNKNLGDYVLVDNKRDLQYLMGVGKAYGKIFDKNGISLYGKNSTGSPGGKV